MSSMRWRLLVGSLLILAGIVALVDAITGLNLGDLVWAVLFIFGGLAFISVLTADRKNWWAAIPGFTLIGIGAEIGIDNLFPVFSEAAGGAFVLGGIGLAFLVVYLLDRSFWWAIIPMGVMFSLVALILLEPYLPGSEVIFFLGLAATFGVLALLPIDNGKRTFWPVIPAGVLLVIGLIAGIGSYNWTGFLMPVVIIAVGVYLLVRAMRAQA